MGDSHSLTELRELHDWLDVRGRRVWVLIPTLHTYMRCDRSQWVHLVQCVLDGSYGHPGHNRVHARRDGRDVWIDEFWDDDPHHEYCDCVERLSSGRAGTPIRTCDAPRFRLMTNALAGGSMSCGGCGEPLDAHIGTASFCPEPAPTLGSLT